MATITLIVAFLAGIVSFLSPCVLPLVPAFLGYISGVVPSQAQNARLRVFMHALFYVLGFSVVFAVLGVLLNTVLAAASYTVQSWLSRLGGLIIIFFGLHLTGLLRIPFLEREHKIEVHAKATYGASFLLGGAFAVGWSPCVGAVLGSVLALAATNPGQSLALLLSYSLGLGIPFLLVGLFAGQAAAWIRKFSGFMKYFNIIVGGLIIILGVLVFTQSLSLLANFSFVNSWVLS